MCLAGVGDLKVSWTCSLLTRPSIWVTLPRPGWRVEARGAEETQEAERQDGSKKGSKQALNTAKESSEWILWNSYRINLVALSEYFSQVVGTDRDRLRKWVLHGEGIQEVENTVMRAFSFLSTLLVFIWRDGGQWVCQVSQPLELCCAYQNPGTSYHFLEPVRYTLSSGPHPTMKKLC